MGSRLKLATPAPQEPDPEPEPAAVEEERRQREYEARMAVLRAAQEKKRDEIRAKNAISRAKALAEATAAEQAARATGTGRLREVAIRFRSGIDLALAKLADEHGVTATVGWSTGDPRYAGGVPSLTTTASRPPSSTRTRDGSAATPSASWPGSC